MERAPARGAVTGRHLLARRQGTGRNPTVDRIDARREGGATRTKERWGEVSHEK